MVDFLQNIAFSNKLFDAALGQDFVLLNDFHGVWLPGADLLNEEHLPIATSTNYFQPLVVFLDSFDLQDLGFDC